MVSITCSLFNLGAAQPSYMYVCLYVGVYKIIQQFMDGFSSNLVGILLGRVSPED